MSRAKSSLVAVALFGLLPAPLAGAESSAETEPRARDGSSTEAEIPLEGEIARCTISVDGLVCPFCAYGLEKKLKKLDGVRSLDISLNEGTATLSVTQGKNLRPADIRSAVEEAGFTPREISITVVGTLSIEGRKVFLRLRGAEGKYLLSERGTGEADGRGALNEKTRGQLSDLAGRGAVVAITGTAFALATGGHGLSTDVVEQVFSITLDVPGVRGEKGALRLEELLKNAEGVYRASVSLLDGQVTVESIGREPGRAALAKVVAVAGLGPVPEKDADRPVGRNTGGEEDKR